MAQRTIQRSHRLTARTAASDRQQRRRALSACDRARPQELSLAGSDASGAILYSLLDTAKLNGIDQEAHLRYVLERIAEHPIYRIKELLPRHLADPLAQLLAA